MISHWDNYQPGDVLDLSRQSPVDFIDEIKMDYIRPYLPKQGTILELGAGSGRLLTRIGLENKNNYRVVGLDYSPTAAQTIHNNQLKFGLNGLSIRGDTLHIPIKDHSVDMLCSGGLLEHFNDIEVNVVLSEMLRVLKPDGILYADIVPRKRSLCRPVIHMDAGGFENDYNLDKWREMFVSNRFKIIDMFSGLILPLNFYGKWAGRHRIKFIYTHKNFIKSLDNTILSDWLGFAYFVFARGA